MNVGHGISDVLSLDGRSVNLLLGVQKLLSKSSERARIDHLGDMSEKIEKWAAMMGKKNKERTCLMSNEEEI